MTNNHLKNIAMSDSGFLFDPTTGSTFTVNETGLTILQLLKAEIPKEEMINRILEEYETTREQVERDISDLTIQLNSLGLWK